MNTNITSDLHFSRKNLAAFLRYDGHIYMSSWLGSLRNIPAMIVYFDKPITNMRWNAGTHGD